MIAGLIFTCFVAITYADHSNETLRHVHVVFRHGDRANIIEPSYITDPYIDEQYLPYGQGELTNRGMQRAYDLGKYLQARYNGFLKYKKNVVQAVCSEHNRAQATLQLVLAGLFPTIDTPFEWNSDLNWQPIPFKSLPVETHLLSLANYDCRNHEYYYSSFLERQSGKKVMEKYRDVFNYLSIHTGSNVSTLILGRSIYYSLLIESEWGFTLPKWTKKVFPRALEDVTLDFFYTSAATHKLKQLTGGFLLKKVIHNTVIEFMKNSSQDKTKIFLYSGHEYNLIYLMIAMGVFKHNLPTYTSCLIIEVHTINRITGLKLYYEDYSKAAPEELTIPGCEHFCPLTQVVTLLKKNIPEDDACEKDIA